MHLDRSGKADRLAGEPLNPGPQRQMCALNLLHVPLAQLRLGGIEMPAVRAPILSVIAPDAKRLEQLLSCKNTWSCRRPNTYANTLPVR
jgi:hypothetical protein